MYHSFSGKRDVYLDVADRFIQYIKLGVIKSGEKLPSVREAAGDMGINPNTVAKAYGVLEEKNLIRAFPKKGAFVIYNGCESKAAQDLRPLLRELKAKGVCYDELIWQAKEVFGKNDTNH